MSLKLLSFSFFILLFACQSSELNFQSQKTETELFNSFLEEYFEFHYRRSPMWQTYLGDKDEHDQLDNETDEYAQVGHEYNRKAIKRLKHFDFKLLDEQSKVSYQLFKYEIGRRIRDFKFRFHNYPVNQMRGIQSSFPSFMINFHGVSNKKDLEDYISRLNDFPRYMEEILDGLKKREEMGIIAPKFALTKAMEAAKNVVKNQSILKDFYKKRDSVKKLKYSEKKKLTKEAKKANTDSVEASYNKLISYIGELIKKAPLEGAANGLPDGNAFYKSRLAYQTTTSMGANEIHELGLSEVERIHNEMALIMEKVKFKGTLQDFYKFIKESNQFKYPNTKEGKQAYLDKATEIIENMKKETPKLFGLRPKADLVVKAVEPFREKSAGLAFYNGPSKDGKRPGIYYVNLYDMGQANKYEMEALAYHEGVPGHHMQIALTRELKSLPRFRRYFRSTAYIEGWGLYSEYIPKEIGLYQDPYSDFGRLSMELWRACRLVVDTGLHAKGWTRQAAIEYLAANTPATEGDNVKAIERYIVIPAQATSYKIGMLKILELREMAKNKLGSRFDIRSFHDEVLKNGPLPLNVLEERINAWIERVR